VAVDAGAVRVGVINAHAGPLLCGIEIGKAEGVLAIGRICVGSASSPHENKHLGVGIADGAWFEARHPKLKYLR